MRACASSLDVASKPAAAERGMPGTLPVFWERAEVPPGVFSGVCGFVSSAFLPSVLGLACGFDSAEDVFSFLASKGNAVLSAFFTAPALKGAGGGEGEGDGCLTLEVCEPNHDHAASSLGSPKSKEKKISAEMHRIRALVFMFGLSVDSLNNLFSRIKAPTPFVEGYYRLTINFMGRRYSTANPYIIVAGHQVRHDEYWRKNAGKTNWNAVLAATI